MNLLFRDLCEASNRLTDRDPINCVFAEGAQGKGSPVDLQWSHTHGRRTVSSPRKYGGDAMPLVVRGENLMAIIVL